MKHQLDMEIEKLRVEAMKEKESFIEDRKDKRTKMEGTQQSRMISQRNNDTMPIDFENDQNQSPLN